MDKRKLSPKAQGGMIQVMPRKSFVIALVVVAIVLGTTAVLARNRKEVVALPMPDRTPVFLSESGDTNVTFTVMLDKRVRKLILQQQDSDGKWQMIARLHDDGKDGDQTKKDKKYVVTENIQGPKATLRIAAKKGLRKLLVSEPFVIEYNPIPVGFKRYEEPEISFIYPEDLTPTISEQDPPGRLRIIEFADQTQIFLIEIHTLQQDQTIIEYANTGKWSFSEPWQDVFKVETIAGITVLRSNLPSIEFIHKQRHYRFTNGVPGWEQGVHNLDSAVFEQILQSLVLH